MAFLSCWQFTMICLLDGCWHRLWSSCAFILSYISFFLSWSMVDLQRCVSFRYVAAAAKSLQSCPTLCNPIDGSPPGSPVPGILQARTPEWVAISFSHAWKWKVKSEREVTQSCLTPSDPMDCSPPGSFVHGFFQARILEWGAIALSERYLALMSNTCSFSEYPIGEFCS